MIECTCGNQDVEFTVVKDIASGCIILEARCNNCGKSATGFGISVEQALKRATRKWRNDGKLKEKAKKQ